MERLVKALDQKLNEGTHFARGLSARRPDDIDACRGYWMPRHYRDQRAGSNVLIGKCVRQPRNSQPRQGGSDKRGAVIGLDSPARLDRDGADLLVRTRAAQQFFRKVSDLVIEENFEIQRLETLDESTEDVLTYLLGGKR